MAFKATLTIDNNTYHMLECLSSLEQKTDARGKPISEVRGGKFQFIVLGTSDDFFPLWATDKKKKHDGVIAMYLWDQDVKFKEISFKNAFVTAFTESYMLDPNPDHDIVSIMHFTKRSNELHRETIMRIHEQFGADYVFFVQISAEEVTVDGVEHSNRW